MSSPQDLETQHVFLNSVVLSVLGAGLSFFAGWFLYWLAGKRHAARQSAEEHTKTVNRIVELEKQLSLVSQAVVPISVAFQAILVKELTHFHTPEMDALMAKLGPPFVLTPSEGARLMVLLDERQRDMNDQISDRERDAALMLPMVMKRILVDRELSGMEAEPLVRIIVSQEISVGKF